MDVVRTVAVDPLDQVHDAVAAGTGGDLDHAEPVPVDQDLDVGDAPVDEQGLAGVERDLAQGLVVRLGAGHQLAHLGEVGGPGLGLVRDGEDGALPTEVGDLDGDLVRGVDELLGLVAAVGEVVGGGDLQESVAAVVEGRGEVLRRGHQDGADVAGEVPGFRTSGRPSSSAAARSSSRVPKVRCRAQGTPARSKASFIACLSRARARQSSERVGRS